MERLSGYGPDDEGSNPPGSTRPALRAQESGLWVPEIFVRLSSYSNLSMKDKQRHL